LPRARCVVYLVRVCGLLVKPMLPEAAALAPDEAWVADRPGGSSRPSSMRRRAADSMVTHYRLHLTGASPHATPSSRSTTRAPDGNVR
jgi:hypothetical protein